MTGVKTRTRSRIFRSDSGYRRRKSWAGATIEEGRVNASITGTQKTVSEGHPWPYKQAKGSFKDVGGDFYTINHYYEDNRIQKPGEPWQPAFYVRGEGIGSWFEYWGPIYPVDPVEKLPQYSPYPVDTYSSDQGELDALGATAIARCKPTNSVADLSVALAEIAREGIPHAVGSSLWRDRTLRARNAGDEYLNVEFGWLPLVGAIQDTARAVKTHDEVWAQYERDAGRMVRRSYEFPHVRSIEDPVVVNSSANPIMLGSNLTGTDSVKTRGVLRRDREVTIRRWFSGAFTYALPTGDSRVERIALAAAEARKVYGLTLDPEVVWNLMPWSWAADWVSNTGDVVSNLTDWATDGLVLKYGYIMEHVTIRDRYTLSGVEWKIQGPKGPFTATFTTEVKQRRKATPFGFGLSWDGFSTRQWAILAALGVTRGR